MFHEKSPAESEPLKILMVVTNITAKLLKTLTTAYAQLLVSTVFTAAGALKSGQQMCLCCNFQQENVCKSVAW